MQGSLLGLLNRLISIELTEPGRDPSRQSTMQLFRNHSNLAALLCGFVVLAHRSFMRGQFLLNLRTVVSRCALKITLGVGELVAVEAELSLCDVQLIAIAGGSGRAGFCRRRRCRSQALDQRLVLRNQLLKLRDLLRERQGIAGELAMVGQQSGLAESRSEGLIHFMIGEALCIPRIFAFLRGDSECRKRLRRLPRTHVDERRFAQGGAGCSPFLPQERKISHGAARGPEKYETKNQNRREGKQEDRPGLAECVLHAGLGRLGSNWGDCHTKHSYKNESFCKQIDGLRRTSGLSLPWTHKNADNVSVLCWRQFLSSAMAVAIGV